MNSEQYSHNIQQQSPGSTDSVHYFRSIIMADHDHGGGNDGSSNSTDTSMMMMMSMSFHGGYTETILFEFWKTTDVWGLVGSVVFIFFLAFAYETLKFYREHLYRRSFVRAVQYNTLTVPTENGGVAKETYKTAQVKMLSAVHTWQTLLHVVQITISYFLMLIFMTYNTWLCLAVALGAGVGYFFFGWKKSLLVDNTEHCH